MAILVSLMSSAALLLHCHINSYFFPKSTGNAPSVSNEGLTQIFEVGCIWFPPNNLCDSASRRQATREEKQEQKWAKHKEREGRDTVPT